MKLEGRIISVLAPESGKSKAGKEWRKQNYVLETEGDYPKKVCFMVWGDKIDEFAIKQNNMVEIDIEIESREFNGRWYTDVKAWKCAIKDSAPQKALYKSPGFVEAVNDAVDDAEDDLPF